MIDSQMVGRRARVGKVSIVTPCRNARALLPHTIRSILGQTAVESGRLQLEYIVCDGASDDGTAEVARSMCKGIGEVISEPDVGMYDALAKGLQRATGDVVAYLNAGDVYSPGALDVVADVFEAHPTRWLTGCAVTLNAKQQVVGFSLPFRYRSSAIARGLYGRGLPHLQQESTFWDRSLHSLIDWERLRRMRLAGDCYLWTRFASEEVLWIVEAYLGGFTVHGNHLSADLKAYWAEAESFLQPRGAADRVAALWDRVLWRGPTRVKKALNPAHLLRYDHSAGCWS